MSRSRRGGGQGREYYELFDRAGRNVLQAAEMLERLMASWPDEEPLRAEIRLCEQEGDRITHDILHRLHTSSSAPPVEPDDVFRLATGLDDVVDFTEEVADLLGLYRIEAPMDQAQELTRVLSAASGTLSKALAELPASTGLEPLFLEIDRLEDDGDRIVRSALASLFAGGIDPILIIRWKDLFERLEEAIDSCERASNTLSGILAKQRS